MAMALEGQSKRATKQVIVKQLLIAFKSSPTIR